MLRGGAPAVWRAASLLLPPRARRCVCGSVRAASGSSPRPDLADVERLARGEAAKRRGTGSREVPHRLNESERSAWELAKKRRFVVLSGTGYRRERKGSPLLNSWRQYADCHAWPCVLVQNGSTDPPRPDVVVVDLSTLRDSRERCRETRDAALALAAPLGASLTGDDTELPEEEEQGGGARGFAIWNLPAVALEFTCADRPAAKALAEALSGALCGAQQLDKAQGKRRASRAAGQTEGDEDGV